MMNLFENNIVSEWWPLVIAFYVVFATAYFLRLKTKRPKQSKEKPVQWKPLPLVEHDMAVEEPPLMGKIDENCLNIGATSFLCMDKEKRIMDAAIKALNKYGVGSCGPRCFYGTADVHLELELRLAKFLDVEDACVYSYGFCTVASALPAYAKKGDIVFADEKVWFAIQTGISAARCTARYFKHNNMDHLESLLSEAANKKELNPKRRAFLIAEGIYLNTGEICPLKRLVKLARKFKLRIILDESLTIGVIGKQGRGITEHLNIPRDEIDLIVGSLEHSFATVGGFCAGSNFMVEHQRLCGLGYGYSASLPPMLTQAAISALDILEEKPYIITELDDCSIKLNKALSKLNYYRFQGNELSPVKHVYIKEDLTDQLKEKYLRNITNYCLDKGVAMTVAAYLRDVEINCPEPSIRIASSRKLNDDNISEICSLLVEAYENVGPKPKG